MNLESKIRSHLSIGLLTMCTIFITLLSCKKESSGGSEPPPKGNDLEGIAIEDSNILSNQLVVLKIKEREKNLTGSIAGKQILFKIVDDTTAIFLAPELSVGKQTLTTNLGNLSLNVQASTSLTEKQVFDGLQKDLTVLNGIDISDQRKKELKGFQTDVLKIFSKLTAQQKEEALAIYSANRKSILQVKSIVKALPERTLLDNETYFEDQENQAFLQKRSSLGEGSRRVNMSMVQPSAASSDYTIISQDCQRQYPGDISSQMGCAARPINTQYYGLEKPLLHFGFFSAMTGMAIYLSPVTLGAATVAGSLSVAVAVYILFAELAPYIEIAWDNSSKFLSEKWVLAKEKVNIPKQTIKSEDSYNLPNYYRARTLSGSDQFPGDLGTFMILKNRILELMAPVRNIFSPMPDYVNKESVIKSTKIKWQVTEVSNSKVLLRDIKENSINFDLADSREESFNYKLHADFFGQRHEVKVNADIRKGYNEDYTILFINTYNPDYSKIKSFTSYKEGDLLNVHSNIYYYYKILFKGQPVTDLNNPILHNIKRMTFGEAPIDRLPEYFEDYGITFYDELNRKEVTLSFKVKLSNEAYSMIAGKTLNVSSPLYWEGRALKLTFHENGKLTIDLPGENFTRQSTWNFEVHTAYDYTYCPNGSEIVTQTIGAVRINLTSADLPPFIILNKDGSYGGSGSSPCGDGFTVR
ncbi:hypothetical protein [Sphingobacterium endophyticum]|uniref:hypothetical protein n=1 Tax=Sphingobacterium endophyticum TaxID=2546448 RepID=UPI0012E2EBD4|nr:hypothetical protein [Sphingobacterium endophyticum]